MSIPSMFRRWHRLALLALPSSLAVATAAHAGVTIGGTRVIMNAKAREASISIKNDDTSPYVVQAWVDDSDGGRKVPLFVAPPLSRLDPGRENLLRVVQSGGALPADRESVFWLNVKEIPERSKEENVLQFAVRTRIKLFYRPAGLSGKPALSRSKLKWAVLNDKANGSPVLRVVNPTPFTVNFTGLNINDGAEHINADMVPALGEVSYPLSSLTSPRSIQVEFTTLNDYGGETPAERVKVPASAKPVALTPVPAKPPQKRKPSQDKARAVAAASESVPDSAAPELPGLREQSGE